MPYAISLLTRPTSVDRPTSFAKRSYMRRDIQGLRAFAVIVVILDHLFAWPSGGFVGVDVFFVISGFLITGHLMREWEKTGSISFLDFYKGRVKRIMPAATLMLLVTVGVSALLLNSSRATSVLWDGVWATLFAGNWRFAASGTDYFQADGPVSPLQHFWSLGVEEQFYFAWPWIMLLALGMAARSRKTRFHPRVVAALILAVLSIASFSWAIFETANSPSTAYFSTFSRAWELGVGALVALAVPIFVRLNYGIRPFCAWVGILGMIVSIFFIDSSQAFPAPTALLPVVSTALVIIAGTGGDQRRIYVLTNPLAGYIGNISYSLYLWHFPVIILGEVFYPDRGIIYYIIVFTAICIFSIFAYHLVEDAIRKSSWLLPRNSRKKKSSTVFTRRYINVALGFLAVVTLSAVAIAVIPNTTAMVDSAASLTSGVTDEATSGASAESPTGPEVLEMQKKLRAALASTTWPKTDPSLDEAIGSPQAAPEVFFCGMPGKFALPECTFGNQSATKTAILLGNSAAMTFALPLIEALGEDWKVVVHAGFGCPFSSVYIPSADEDIAADCGVRNKATNDLIADVKADAVFIMDSYTPHQIEGAKKPMSATEWTESVYAAVEEFKSETLKVVLLSPPPRGGNLAECYTNVATPKDCVSQPDKYWMDVRAADMASANQRGAIYIDTLDLFCVNRVCPSFAGGVPMKSDGTHMTIEYGQMIVPGFREILATAAVL